MEKKDKRVAITVPPEIYKKFVALATVEGKPIAAFVRAVLSEYLDRRAVDVEKAMQFVDAQKKSLEDFRAKNSLAE